MMTFEINNRLQYRLSRVTTGSFIIMLATLQPFRFLLSKVERKLEHKLSVACVQRTGYDDC